MFGLGGQLGLLISVIGAAVVLGCTLAHVAASEYAKFKAGPDSDEQTRNKIKDALRHLGETEIDKHGRIQIHLQKSLMNPLVVVRVQGDMKNKEDQYKVFLDIDCKLSLAGWIVLLFGTLFMLLGLLVLIAPARTRNITSRAIRRAFREMED